MKPEGRITLDGQMYVIGWVDAIEQLHLFRRIAPLISKLGGEVYKILTGKTEPGGLSQTDWILLAMPMMDELAVMPQDDVNYLIRNTLKVVRVQAADTWAPVMNPSSGALMQQDMEMTTMLRLMVEVIKQNLSRFFSMPQDVATSSEEGQSQGAPNS